MIFKDSAEINKKEKDKTTFKTAYNRVREVRSGPSYRGAACAMPMGP